ncbi:MAG: hypothetical protein DCC71_14140 [Proteobacteria bacterium]|nr:MAG: hypothetical protein DCC71_14140 [Pseudomonadota bacterium]
MRLLLDECVAQRLKRELAQHRVRTVTEAGWSGVKDSLLLAAAQRQFDVLVTVDRSFRYQHDVRGFDIAIVVLEARSNRIEDLRPLMPRLLGVLSQLRPGRVLHLRAE